jgi:hypothetical protein
MNNTKETAESRKKEAQQLRAKAEELLKAVKEIEDFLAETEKK